MKIMLNSIINNNGIQFLKKIILKKSRSFIAYERYKGFQNK